MSGAVEKARRDAMNHHDQMLDAQAGCVPCKLCGGKAVITDAGTGAGYYIQCGNSLSFRDHKGCMLDGRRTGGWAYNVMEWWNRLHAVTTPPARSYADEDHVYAKGRQDGYAAGRSHALDDAAQVADDYEQHTGDPAFDAATDVAAVTIGERIRLLSQGGKA